MTEADPLFTEKETAPQLFVKKTTLTKWRSRGKGPAFLRLGGKIRYRLSDIRSFIEASRIDPAVRKAERKSKRTRRG